MRKPRWQIYWRKKGETDWRVGRDISIDPDRYCDVRNKSFGGEKEFRYEPLEMAVTPTDALELNNYLVGGK